jgi:hypothetical protein
MSVSTALQFQVNREETNPAASSFDLYPAQHLKGTTA